MSEKVHYLIKEETLQEIAQAVRNKTNETGEIVVSELADKINNIEGGGGVSVQSDWNQTDETAADFIKNRPFGYDTVVAFDGICDLNLGEGLGMFMIDYDLTNSDVIIVEWDGVTYTCPLEYLQNEDGSLTYFVGNLGDNDIPFTIFFQEKVVGVLSVDTDITSVPLKIIGTGFVKLSHNYFTPYIILYVGVNESYLYHDIYLTQKVTKDELTTLAETAPIQIRLISVSNGVSIGYFVYTAASYIDCNNSDYGYIITLQGDAYYTAEHQAST